MTFVLHAVLDELKVAEKRFYDELTKTMDKFCDHGMVPVDRLLLSSDHPAVQEMLQDAEAMGKVRQERKEEEEGQAAEGNTALATTNSLRSGPRSISTKHEGGYVVVEEAIHHWRLAPPIRRCKYSA